MCVCSPRARPNVSRAGGCLGVPGSSQRPGPGLSGDDDGSGTSRCGEWAAWALSAGNYTSGSLPSAKVSSSAVATIDPLAESNRQRVYGTKKTHSRRKLQRAAPVRTYQTIGTEIGALWQARERSRCPNRSETTQAQRPQQGEVTPPIHPAAHSVQGPSRTGQITPWKMAFRLVG